MGTATHGDNHNDKEGKEGTIDVQQGFAEKESREDNRDKEGEVSDSPDDRHGAESADNNGQGEGKIENSSHRDTESPETPIGPGGLFREDTPKGEDGSDKIKDGGEGHRAAIENSGLFVGEGEKREGDTG